MYNNKYVKSYLGYCNLNSSTLCCWTEKRTLVFLKSIESAIQNRVMWFIFFLITLHIDVQHWKSKEKNKTQESQRTQTEQRGKSHLESESP